MSMVTFTTLLESLRNPYPWRLSYSNTNEYEASFMTAGMVSYVVHFDLINSVLNKYSVYELAFMIDQDDWADKVLAQKISTGPFGVAGTGDAFRVFATVIDILRAFIKKYNPQRIEFNAEEASRAKLYDRLIKLVATEIPGYRGTSSGRNYTIERSTPLGGALHA
jgi:hypothetical protein